MIPPFASKTSRVPAIERTFPVYIFCLAFVHRKSDTNNNPAIVRSGYFFALRATNREKRLETVLRHGFRRPDIFTDIFTHFPFFFYKDDGYVI